MFRRAEATASALAGRISLASNLCAFLRLRFERTEAEDDIDLSVDTGRRAIEMTPADSAYRARSISASRSLSCLAAIALPLRFHVRVS